MKTRSSGAYLALVGLFLILGLAIWEPFPPGIWHDDGVYVLLGQALAQGEGLRYLGVPGSPLAPKFPPLYPLLLSLVWRIYPSFPDNVSFLGGLNLLILATGAGIFAAYLRKVLKLGMGFAMAVTILAWISPQLWRVALVPLSEPLFLLLLVGALWAAGRSESSPGTGPVVTFLALAGAVLYARTLGVGLFLGAAVAMAMRRRWKAVAGIITGLVVLWVPWLLWTSRAARTLPAPLQDTLGPYGSWWIRQVAADPGAFLGFLGGSVRGLLLEVSSLLLPWAEGPLRWLGILLLVPLAVGLRELARRSWTLPLSLGISLAVLVAWPFRDIRLLVPFSPFLVLSTALGWLELYGQGSGGRSWKGAVGGLAVAWLLLMASASIVRLATGWPGEPYRIRSEALVEAVRAVEEKTPPDAVVGAPELWSGIHLFTGRSALPSARFLPLAKEGPSWGTPREQYELWVATGLTHLLVEHGGRVHGEALDRVDAVCPSGTVEVLDLQPGQFLVSLNWDRACQERVLGPDG